MLWIPPESLSFMRWASSYDGLEATDAFGSECRMLRFGIPEELRSGTTSVKDRIRPVVFLVSVTHDFAIENFLSFAQILIAQTIAIAQRFVPLNMNNNLIFNNRHLKGKQVQILWKL